jgi:hypothetical protein
MYALTLNEILFPYLRHSAFQFSTLTLKLQREKKMTDPTNMTYADQRTLILSMLKSTLGDERVTYLSGPITGGKRFVEWHVAVGSKVADDDQRRSLCQSQVINFNILALQKLASDLRKQDIKLIEPGSFETPPLIWPQKEFYALWREVIQSHAKAVRCVDGWQFSVGCAYEYLCAIECTFPKIDTEKFDGAPLPPTEALELIKAASDSLTDSDVKLIELKTKLETMHAAIAFHSQLPVS